VKQQFFFAALLASAALGKSLSSAPHIKPQSLCRRFASGCKVGAGADCGLAIVPVYFGLCLF